MEVLVVDDADDIRLMLRHVLSLGGHTTIEAPGGPEALAIVRSRRVDVVVLDIQMPDMDGWQTLSAIRADPRTASVPVIMCSVKSREEDQLRGWELGCDGYMKKPFDVLHLLEEITAVVTRPESERREIRRRAVLAITQQLA